MAAKNFDIIGAYVPAQVQLVYDSTGQYAFSPESLAVTYGYDGSGNLQTETRGPDQSGLSYKKTYGFTGSILTSESMWVKV